MTALTDMVDYEVTDGVGVITVNNPPVNALSQGVRQGLKEGIEKALGDDAVQAALIICEGRTYIAGADITEFGKPPQEPGLHGVLDTMEAAGKPVVSAIHGTALGGGLETALSCHYRVADGKARFGLPEVKLGLLPGAGGTQRLPRIMGVEKALDMVTTGNMVGAKEALANGLIDEIVDDLKAGGIAFAKKIAAGNKELVKVRDMNEKLESARANPSIFDDYRKKNAKRMRGFEAPEANIKCIEAAVNMTFDDGMKFERDEFMKLMKGNQSAAQQYFFFAEREAAKIPDIGKDVAEIPVNKVAVIGGGTMGGGISMNFANAGIPVTMVEVSDEALERGIGIIRRNYENTAKKGRMTEEQVEQRMSIISGATSKETIGDCDMVIEAVFENMDLKKSIFAELDGIMKPGAILASNTSALDVNEIASATKRPEAVIGTHFFSPANVMKLVEVVRGDATSKEVVKTCMSLSKKIGKVAVQCGVCHGFIGNRMLYGRGVQANKMILEGAPPQDVDKVIFDFGFPMGPFAMSDLAGLDIGWNKDTTSSSTVREILCEMDRRGQKAGAGFYDYNMPDRTPIPNAEVQAIITKFAEDRQITQRDVSDQEILERCLFPMVNEGAKILEEGIANRASDIDVVWIYGYGWPIFTGGPMFWADSYGLDKLLAKMKEYQAQHGDEFKPAKLIEDLVAEGKSFKDFAA
jgi:3-hydroxyacyl-CoA dehydrogenase